MLNFNEIREMAMKREELFSPFACKSNEAIRLNKEEKENDIRLDFARDTDRIVHALSYTRYIDKTQVYTDSGNDNISTRMTHVQFVSRAARTISRALGLNEDLSEAIALGHDIGHTPFGHVGEYILDELSFEKNETHFAHNLNSVRVFTKLENNGRGCNLTLQVLDGIMTHNGEMVKAEYRPMPKTCEKFLEEYHMCLQDNSKIKNIRPMTMEGCVVRLSDIIGYLGKDIEDSKRLKGFDIDTLPQNVKEVLGTSNAQIMNNIILDVVKESYHKPYISLSDKMYEAIVDLKNFNYENIYKKAIDDDKRKEYKTILYTLYDVYEKALNRKDKENHINRIFLNNMSKDYLENTSDFQKIIDYLSGMTDNFVEKEYRKYK